MLVKTFNVWPRSVYTPRQEKSIDRLFSKNICSLYPHVYKVVQTEPQGH